MSLCAKSTLSSCYAYVQWTVSWNIWRRFQIFYRFLFLNSSQVNFLSKVQLICGVLVMCSMLKLYWQVNTCLHLWDSQFEGTSAHVNYCTRFRTELVDLGMVKTNSHHFCIPMLRPQTTHPHSIVMMMMLLKNEGKMRL